MSGGLLLAVCAVYLWVAVDYLQHQRWGMALAFLAYALANIGFAWDGWR